MPKFYPPKWGNNRFHMFAIFGAVKQNYKAIRAWSFKELPCVHSFVEDEKMRSWVGFPSSVVFQFKIYHNVAFKELQTRHTFPIKFFQKKKRKKRKHSREVEGFKKASFFLKILPPRFVLWKGELDKLWFGEVWVVEIF